MQFVGRCKAGHSKRSFLILQNKKLLKNKKRKLKISIYTEIEYLFFKCWYKIFF